MPWPLEKDFLVTLGMAEELPVMWSTLGICAECFHAHAHDENDDVEAVADAVVVCQKCRCVRYCSEECRSDHARDHSSVCAKLVQIQFPKWNYLDLKGPELKLEGYPEDNNTTNTTSTSSTASNPTKISCEDVMLLTRQCLQGNFDPSELEMPDPPQTVVAARQLLEQTASTGLKDAQFGMALVSAKAGLDQEALRWTRQAAHSGLADAQVRYAMQYWLDGTADHKVDFIQAILWLRRALAQGRSGLSEPAFLKATNLTRTMANQYYNTLNRFEMKQRGIGYQREMKLVAECGIVGAINMVWLVHSKGSWYDQFFAQLVEVNNGVQGAEEATEARGEGG